MIVSPTGVRHEVFFREDIKNVLRSIDSANACLADHVPTSQVAIYRAGFTAALQAVALAFDVRLDVASQKREVWLQSVAQLLPDGA